ncbi:MAG: hypothetical protein WC823_02865 [Parcubacteria group bacterium]|jgi:hypothetical protein
MSVTTEIIAFNKNEAEKALTEFFEHIRNNNLSGEYFTSLKQAYTYDDYEILAELENIYLHIGSVAAFVNSPMGDDQHISQLESMVEYFDLELADDYGIPTKDSLIKLYSLINDENIDEIAEEFGKTDGYEAGEAREILIETIVHLKPLVKKLKGDADSILVISHDYDFPNVLPENFDSFLQDRIAEIREFIENDSEIFSKLK